MAMKRGKWPQGAGDEAGLEAEEPAPRHGGARGGYSSRRYSVAEKVALVAEFEQSGETFDEFCARRHISSASTAARTTTTATSATTDTGHHGMYTSSARVSATRSSGGSATDCNRPAQAGSTPLTASSITTPATTASGHARSRRGAVSGSADISRHTSRQA